jgi:hypothetical protein
MPQKIKGNIGEAGRILIFDESDLNTVEVNTVVGTAGAFDIEVPTEGTKMIIARSNSGGALGYSMVNSIYEDPPFAEYTQDFTVPAQNYACGVQISNNTIERYNTDTTRIGSFTGIHYNPWFWLPNITIAQGATIFSSVLKTELRGMATGITTMTVAGSINLADNATPPTSSATWANKVRSVETTWSLPPGTIGSVYNWSDMASHLQQVVNRPGWSSGNAILLLFRETSYTTKTNYYATGFGAQNQGWAYPTLTVSWREYP